MKVDTSVSTKFECLCGKMQGWIAEGEFSDPCPICKRRYKGRYDKKKDTIKAVWFKNIKRK